MLMGEARKREALGIDTVLVSQYGACSAHVPSVAGACTSTMYSRITTVPGVAAFGVSRNGKQSHVLSICHEGRTIPSELPPYHQYVGGRDIQKARAYGYRGNRTYQQAGSRTAEDGAAVRKAKRKAAGLQDPSARKEGQWEIRQLQADLRKFISDNGDALRRDYWRERHDGVRQNAESENMLRRDVPTSAGQSRNVVENVKKLP